MHLSCLPVMVHAWLSILGGVDGIPADNSDIIHLKEPTMPQKNLIELVKTKRAVIFQCPSIQNFNFAFTQLKEMTLVQKSWHIIRQYSSTDGDSNTDKVFLLSSVFPVSWDNATAQVKHLYRNL